MEIFHYSRQGAKAVEMYLDTEFNGLDGELISIAIAADDGSRFYAELPEPRVWNEWVFANVFPHLKHEPEERSVARFRLLTYLRARPNAIIYADWPTDFTHLMQLMAGSVYEPDSMVPCTMVLLDGTEPKPVTPHNAMSDAEALMEWHQQLMSRGGYRSTVVVF